MTREGLQCIRLRNDGLALAPVFSLSVGGNVTGGASRITTSRGVLGRPSTGLP